MDKNRKVVVKILKALCDDRRKQATPELIMLWQIALEDFSDEVIMLSFRNIVKNRSRSIGFDITHDEFVENCRNIRTNISVNGSYDPKQIGFEEPKQLEDLSAESKSNEDTSSEELKKIKERIEENRTVSKMQKPSFAIAEEVDVDGNVTGFICHGYVNDVDFQSECLNQYGVDIKTVIRKKAKTMAVSDGRKIWISTKITSGYLA